jgi:hypothetical protein
MSIFVYFQGSANSSLYSSYLRVFLVHANDGTRMVAKRPWTQIFLGGGLASLGPSFEPSFVGDTQDSRCRRTQQEGKPA